MTVTESGSGPIRVFVVDDQQLVCDGIASVLDLEPGLSVVGTAAEGREALDRLACRPADVVLMDMRMPGMDGVEATAAVRRLDPSCKVLVLSTFNTDEYLGRALRAGACGYLLKDLPADELAQAVRAAHGDVSVFAPAMTTKLAAALEDEPVGADDGKRVCPDLTVREVEVLSLLACGATNRQIAAELIVAEGTVKNHVSRILHRLGLERRTQAAIYARERGLGDSGPLL